MKDITKQFGDYKVTLSPTELTVGCQKYKLKDLPKIIAAARDLIKRLPKPLKIDGDIISDVYPVNDEFVLNGRCIMLPDKELYSLLKPAVRKYLESTEGYDGSNTVCGVCIEVEKYDGELSLVFGGESISIDLFNDLVKWVESKTRKPAPKKKQGK